MKAKKVVELCVHTGDRPGVLECVASALASASVNIVAMAGYGGGGKACLMIVTDKPAKASAVLRKGGLKVGKSNVLIVEVPNKVGALAAVASKVASAKVNLNYVYATTCGVTSSVVMSANNMAKLGKALR